jgi:hypothetical protein
MSGGEIALHGQSLNHLVKTMALAAPQADGNCVPASGNAGLDRVSDRKTFKLEDKIADQAVRGKKFTIEEFLGIPVAQVTVPERVEQDRSFWDLDMFDWAEDVENGFSSNPGLVSDNSMSNEGSAYSDSMPGTPFCGSAPMVLEEPKPFALDDKPGESKGSIFGTRSSASIIFTSFLLGAFQLQDKHSSKLL